MWVAEHSRCSDESKWEVKVGRLALLEPKTCAHDRFIVALEMRLLEGDPGVRRMAAHGPNELWAVAEHSRCSDESKWEVKVGRLALLEPKTCAQDGFNVALEMRRLEGDPGVGRMTAQGPNELWAMAEQTR